MKKSHFTLGVRGHGVLIGMFFTEAFKAFPNATIYDQSDQFKKAVGQEADIARTGYMRPEDSKRALRAEQNVNNPKKTDVTAIFSGKGYQQDVAIKGRRRDRSFSFNMTDKSWNKIEKFLDKLVREVEKAL